MLTRKKSLRQSYEDKLRREGISQKARKPLRKVSKKQENRLARYYPLRAQFLSEPGNAERQICIRRQRAGENIRVNLSTEVHHFNGRAGKNLFSGFIASCRPCRMWPHDNIAKAKALGLLK